jgi:hypothetical protein
MTIRRNHKDAVIWQWRVNLSVNYEGAPRRDRDRIVPVCATMILKEDTLPADDLDEHSAKDATMSFGTDEISFFASVGNELGADTDNSPSIQTHALSDLLTRSDKSRVIANQLTADESIRDSTKVPTAALNRMQQIFPRGSARRVQAVQNCDDNMPRPKSKDRIVPQIAVKGRQRLRQNAETKTHSPPPAQGSITEGGTPDTSGQAHSSLWFTHSTQFESDSPPTARTRQRRTSKKEDSSTNANSSSATAVASRLSASRGGSTVDFDVEIDRGTIRTSSRDLFASASYDPYYYEADGELRDAGWLETEGLGQRHRIDGLLRPPDARIRKRE